MRYIACAGVLTAGLLIVAANAGIAFADTGDAAGATSETAAVTSKADENNSDSDTSGASNPEPPSSTFGNGRDDVGIQTKDEDKNISAATPATKKYQGSLAIPFFRIPRRDELPPSGLPNPALFYTTIVIPVPTLGEFFAAMQPQPQPQPPAPGPTFRTQEVGPPVVDSAGGGGGGVDPLAVGVAAEPPVLQAPLVIAPLPIPLSAPAAAAGSAPAPAVADVAVAGARVPPIRGSLEPTVSLPPAAEPATNPVTSMSGQATRLGYPRELRTQTAVEVTMLALPGVAGLLMLTVSGGVIGYRQANSARLLRAEAAARFLR